MGVPGRSLSWHFYLHGIAVTVRRTALLQVHVTPITAVHRCSSLPPCLHNDLELLTDLAYNPGFPLRRNTPTWLGFALSSQTPIIIGVVFL